METNKIAVLTLPRLAGVRGSARNLTAELPDNLIIVIVRCIALEAGTGGYADELVRQVLVERNTSMMEFWDCDDERFAQYVERQAVAHGVQGRIAWATIVHESGESR